MCIFFCYISLRQILGVLRKKKLPENGTLYEIEHVQKSWPSVLCVKGTIHMSQVPENLA
jgi:hypothetical protein